MFPGTRAWGLTTVGEFMGCYTSPVSQQPVNKWQLGSQKAWGFSPPSPSPDRLLRPSVSCCCVGTEPVSERPLVSVCLSVCWASRALILSTAWGQLCCPCVPWVANVMPSLAVPPAARQCLWTSLANQAMTKVKPWEGKIWRRVCSTPDKHKWVTLKKAEFLQHVI